MNTAVAQDESKQLPIAENLGAYLQSLEDDFSKKVSKSKSDISFEQECHFAKQQLLKSDFAINTARSNRQSLHDAILNVGAIGLSLNPASAWAYLVPRDKAIRLDISYRGLCKLATDTGVIKWIQSAMIFANDDFSLTSINQTPVHNHDPLSDRGEFKGVYCVAKTNEGDFLTDVMSADEIYKIRNLSKAYQSAQRDKKNNSVWHLWFDQMALKTVVKRASKMWPVSDGSERLHTAIEVLNEQEQYTEISGPRTSYTIEQKEALNAAMEAGDEMSIYRMARDLDVNVWTGLCNSFDQGEKGKMRDIINTLDQKAIAQIVDAVQQLTASFNSDDTAGAGEILLDYTADQAEFIFKHESMTNEVAEWARAILK